MHHHIGNVAAGNREVQLVAEAVAGHDPGEGDVHVQRVFDVLQGAVVFDGLAFGHQRRVLLAALDEHHAGAFGQRAVSVGLAPGLCGEHVGRHGRGRRLGGLFRRR